MSTTPVRYETELRVDSQTGRYQGRLEALIHLTEPQPRVVLLVPAGSAGRAEALFGKRNWAAAHYWAEETPEGDVVVYEFSEPLPAGDVRLVVPIAGPLTPGLVAAASSSPAELAKFLPHLPDAPGDWSVRVVGADAAPSATAP